ncbi:hypothetical protein ABWH96_00090 [Marivirga tractuosa]|uniref:hypothetical protein n=1 Tax=Marivirga tractuosa TaxID=1006 RepID=UPI0035D06012
MKRFSVVLVALFLCNSFQMSAQEKPAALIKGEAATVANNLVKVEALFPNVLAVSYEKKLGQSISLYNAVGLFAYYGGGVFAQVAYGSSPYYIFMPQITVQPRFYHNLSKRAASNRNTNNNSANYVGLSSRFYHENLNFTNTERYPKGSAVLDLMISYGLQRSFFKGVNLDMAFQPGVRITDEGAELLIGVNLQLGFIVFSK